MSEASPGIVTKSRLTTDLRGLGLCAGQDVMLHASVKAIGWVVGGPHVVLQALLDVLTPEGTLMMMVGWEDGPYELAEWPVEKQKAYLNECPAFDPATSPAYRKWSVLTEYLRTWQGACRSTNPDKSFAAVGKQARFLTENHALSYGYGPDSPLGKLCTLGGKVLLLGPLLASVTLVHHSEHLACVPDKPVVRYRMPILKNGQRQWVDVEEFDTNRPIGLWSGGDYFETIVCEYLCTGQGRQGKVGYADSYLLDAAPLNRFAVTWLERTFGTNQGSAAIKPEGDVRATSERHVDVRPVCADDRAEWLRMRIALWPHHDPAELEHELDQTLARLEREPVFVAVRPDGSLCGFLEVSIRDHAAGCKTRTVGYLEGWYVDPDMRRKGIGRMLVKAAEAWARKQGCREMGSDTDERYPLSQCVHEALGYTVVERSLHFRKLLEGPSATDA